MRKNTKFSLKKIEMGQFVQYLLCKETNALITRIRRSLRVITNVRNFVTTLILCKKHEIQNMGQKNV
jgi:hypothetical protein